MVTWSQSSIARKCPQAPGRILTQAVQHAVFQDRRLNAGNSGGHPFAAASEGEASEAGEALVALVQTPLVRVGRPDTSTKFRELHADLLAGVECVMQGVDTKGFHLGPTGSANTVDEKS